MALAKYFPTTNHDIHPTIVYAIFLPFSHHFSNHDDHTLDDPFVFSHPKKNSPNFSQVCDDDESHSEENISLFHISIFAQNKGKGNERE